LTKSEMFKDFLSNLAIDNADQISLRYGEVTACLNKNFRDTESKTANSLQVGSYGRWTAIKGVSDLDMLYIMPAGSWDTYKNNNQSQLLKDCKDTIKSRYPKTVVIADRLVVRVLYNNFHIEVQPVFELEDGSFQYPDTYNGGSWKVTKPREEISAMKEFDMQKNRNLRRFCKMTRAWKNKHGVKMGGLLIDTLAHNFLKSTSEYDDTSFLYYDRMSRDFFKYLAEQPDQEYYAALGSGQRVNVKKKFQKKAKKAYELCLSAIESEGEDSIHSKWKQVFGRPFPSKPTTAHEAAILKAAQHWDDTEEFIEDMFPVDIRYSLQIDCDVLQNGFQEHALSFILRKKWRLQAKKKLKFHITYTDVEGQYSIYWKVLNRGEEARKRNEIRGQILADDGHNTKVENTKFRGNHIVECYAVKNGVVVARDLIDVPIQ